MGLPPELLEHFRAIGIISRDGSTRAARARPCTRCGALLMVGETATPGAYTVQADAAPLDPIGEVLALLAGRATYDARWLTLARHYELDHRDRHRISAHPAGTPDQVQEPGSLTVVLAAHVCGAPGLPLHRPTAQLMAARVKAARNHDPWNSPGDPPF